MADAPTCHSSSTESLFIPDLLGGMTVMGSAQGGNKPGPMALNAASQLREHVDGTQTSFDLAWDLDALPFNVRFGMLWPKFPSVKPAVMQTSPGR